MKSLVNAESSMSLEQTRSIQNSQGVLSLPRQVWRRVATATLAIICLLSAASSGQANDTGYAISITPHNDPLYHNPKVRIDGKRILVAHVVRTPSGTPASGVTVNFSTTRGTLTTLQGTTNANGDIGTTLEAGWTEGTATVKAQINVNGTSYEDTAAVPIVAPDGEGTFVQSNSANYTDFGQNLTPNDVDFAGLSVTERSGGGGYDSCHYSGSPYAQFTYLTGGTWTVYPLNFWGPDTLNWAAPQITHYRSHGRAPCSATVTQHMDVVRPATAGGNLFYTSNSSQLINRIGATTVTNIRDNVEDVLAYP